MRHTRTIKEGETTRTETYYTHHRDWFGHTINSDHFHERWHHENPNVDFPFEDDCQQAEEVNMGMTFLKSGTISQLGSNEHTYEWKMGMELQLGMANQQMFNKGFGALLCHGEYLYSQANGWEDKEIGRYRIRYTTSPCGEATIIGQQIQDERMLMTIRKYNPNKKNAPYGASTDTDLKAGCCGIENAVLCCYCMCA